MQYHENIKKVMVNRIPDSWSELLRITSKAGRMMDQNIDGVIEMMVLNFPRCFKETRDGFDSYYDSR